MKKNEITRQEAQGNAAKKSFKGYTMEELRYQKALVALRKEFCKANMMHALDSIKKPSSSKALKAAKALPLIGQAAKALPIVSDVKANKSAGSSALAIGKTALKVAVGRLKPLDYAFLAFSLIGPTVKIIKLFKKKKK